MKVLAFAFYPVEAAATRYSLHQFVEPLIECDTERLFGVRATRIERYAWLSG